VPQAPKITVRCLHRGTMFGSLNCKHKTVEPVMYSTGKDKKRHINSGTSMELWSLAFDSLSDLIIILDANNRIVRINRSMAKRLGIEAETAIGRFCFDVVLESNCPPAICPHNCMPETDQAIHTEAFEKKLSCLFDCSVSPIQDAGGSIIGFLQVACESSARKQSEKLVHIQRDLGFDLAQAQSLKEAFKISLSASLKIDGIDSGGIYLMNEASTMLELQVHENLSSEFIDGAATVVQGDRRWDIAKSGIILHGKTGEFFTDNLKNEGIKAVVIIPVIHEGRLLACFNLASKKHVAISKLSRIALEEIATKIGGTIVRITAEKKMRESEYRYRLLAENTTDLISLNKPGGVFLYISPACRTIYGYDSEELKGMDLYMHTHPDDLEVLTAFDQKLSRPPFKGSMRHRFRRKDGTYVWLESNGKGLQPYSDRADLVHVVVTRDITGRIKHENKLKDAQESLEQRVKERTGALSQAIASLKLERDRAQTYLDVSGVMILTVGRDGRVVTINKKGCEILEADENEIIGKIWIDNFEPEETRKNAWHIFREIISGNLAPFDTIEADLVTANGKRKTIAWKNSVIRDSEGHIVGTLSSGENVTQRKRAEAQLQRSKALLQTIFDGISDPLIMMDRHMKIKMLNRAAFAYYGVGSIPNIIGSECYKSLHGKNTICEGCIIATSISNKNPRTFSRKSPFSADRFEQVDIFPLPGENGNSGGMVIHISDITEKKRMDEQLMRADRLSSLGQLAGGIAHEIRNPLTGIRLFMDILSDPERFSLSAQQEELYCEVTENVLKIEEIIGRTLDLARSSEPNRVKIDVNNLIRRSMQLWQLRISKSRIRLTLDLHVTSPSVIGDEIQLQQVLNNMVSNALDAMGKGGDLQIATRVERAAFHNNRRVAKIVISDTGTGLPEDQIQNIFNPFFTTKTTGTGLGLAISHKIVHQHGGIITFENRCEGGARFTIEFPKAGENA
jgi:PAS domain S-box-containing protein